MAETAYLVNPRRRRRRRSVRHNPRRRRRSMTGMVRSLGQRRRYYRRNPEGSTGWLAAGAGLYGVGINFLRRLWVRRNDADADQAKAVASWESWKPWIKVVLFGGGGFLLTHTKWRSLKSIGLSFMVAGVADGVADFSNKIGFSAAEEKAAAAAEKSGGTGNLATMLIERDRQMRAAYDDEFGDELEEDLDDVNGDDFEDVNDADFPDRDGMGFAIDQE